MLDLIEGAKVIYGISATGLNAAGAYADWIDMEAMHCVWSVCSQEAGTSGLEVAGFAADDNAAGGVTRAACQYWYTTGLAIDKFNASTQTTGYRLADGAGGVVLVRYDPASQANSTMQFFSCHYSSGDSVLSIMYVGQPRFGGIGQILATSSST